MHTNLIAIAVIAALLLTGTAVAVSQEGGQSAQLPQTVAAEATTDAPTQAATEAVVQANEPAQPTAPAPAMLTREEALTIALDHAGVTADQAAGIHMEDDTHEQPPHWDIEWRVDDWEYEYRIHAQTGAVLESVREYDPPETVPAVTAPIPAATEPAPTEPAEPAPTESAPKYLTAEEALSVALKHAGLTAEEITRPETEPDLDERVPHYDVDFRCGDWEYEYKIHAETGAVLEATKEQDPPKAPAVTEPAPAETEPAAKYLTAEEALSIALKHAGLTAEEITRPKTEFDWDDGVPVYEVEFRRGSWEYSYEIHAETGKILEQDKELDD